jgi:hypothetical protein
MKIMFEGTFEEFSSLFLAGARISTGSARSRASLPRASQDGTPQERAPVPSSIPSPIANPPGFEHIPSIFPEHHGAYSVTEAMPEIEAIDQSPEWGALPAVSAKTRLDSWKYFVDTMCLWIQGFEVESAEQPDRVKLIKELGSGPWPISILVMAFEIGSLQRLVQRALRQLVADGRAGAEIGRRVDDLDYVDRVTAQMVQLCHAGFPDLQSTYDYSTRWRRIEPNWSEPR